MSTKDGGEAAALDSASREVTILNKYGIHARPAAMFVKTAGQFACDIKVAKEGMVVNGKSIMGLLTLEGYKGVTLTLTATGANAEQALDALQALVDSKFDEE